MKDSDKITLTFGQLKRLVEESEELGKYAKYILYYVDGNDYFNRHNGEVIGEYKMQGQAMDAAIIAAQLYQKEILRTVDIPAYYVNIDYSDYDPTGENPYISVFVHGFEDRDRRWYIKRELV